MGDPLKLKENKPIGWNDITKYFVGIIPSIITQIKNIVNDLLYSWVIEKLTPLLTLFSLRLIAEQIETYRQLISDMITACAGFKGFSIQRKHKNGEIDVVDYVDIDPQIEETKLTPVSKTNC